MKIPKTFPVGQLPGLSIRVIRHEKALTQNDLASMSGYSVRTIEDIERSRHIPKFPTVKDIFEAMGYEIVARRKK